MGRLERALKIVEKLSKMFFYVGVISLIVLFLLIFFDVMGRFIFHIPIKGSDVYSQYLMVCVGFLALGFGQLRGTHPKMEYFGDYLYKKQKVYIELFTTLLATAFFCLMTVQIARQTLIDLSDQILQSNTTISIPIWYQGLLAAIGCIVLILVLLTEFTRKLLKLLVKVPGRSTVINSVKGAQ